MATAKRLYLHIGTPKSGTSYVQAVLRENQDRLPALGFQYPSAYTAEMYHSALEVRGIADKWGVPEEKVTGTWARLCERARRFSGTTVVSTEFYAAATPEQVARVVREAHGLELHVVITARDMARQFPAAWQQGIKHGAKADYRTYQKQLMDNADSSPRAQSFWSLQHLPDIIERWSTGVPAERIHLVTCPPAGAPSSLLWERFCAVVGLDAGSIDPPTEAANTSLGVTEIELLRQLNHVVEKGEDYRFYGRMVNNYFVNQTLRTFTSPRPQTPPDLLPVFERLAEEWTAAIRASGCSVTGDLDDLRPTSPAREYVDPSAVPADEVITLAAASIRDLLKEVDRLQHRVDRGRRRTARAGSSLPRRAVRKVRRAWGR